MAISASGNSSYIIRCLETVRMLGASWLGLLGFHGACSLALCDQAIVVISQDYAMVEGARRVLSHVLTSASKPIVQAPAGVPA